MSTTTAAQNQRTVTVQLDDPFSSLFQPSYEPGPASGRNKASAFANAPINTTHKPQTYMRADVAPKFSDPLLQPHSALANDYVAKTDYIKAKRSARDGWLAVAILGTFIAVGSYWIVERVGSDALKIDNLTTQVATLNKSLTSERGVVISRNKEVQLLTEQLGDERARAAKLAKTAKK